MDGVKYPSLYCCLLLAKMVFNNSYNPPHLDTWRNQPVLSSRKQVAPYRKIISPEAILNSKYQSINFDNVMNKKIRGSLLSIYIPKMNKPQNNVCFPSFIHKQLETLAISPETTLSSPAQYTSANTSTDFKVHEPILFAQWSTFMRPLLIRKQYPAITYQNELGNRQWNTTLRDRKDASSLRNELQDTNTTQEDSKLCNKESGLSETKIFNAMNNYFDAKDIKEGIKQLKSEEHVQTYTTIIAFKSKHSFAIQWIQDYLLSKNINPIRLFREKSIPLEEDPKDLIIFDVDLTELNYNE